MKIVSSIFEGAAYRPAEEPKGRGPCVVFLGRSNVGKSSLINKLLKVKGLARTSSQPGRTQSVNFYRINDAFYFVDLPGYGFARVPKAVSAQWGPLVEGFLDHNRKRIVMSCLIVDSRRAPTMLDATMRHWLEDRQLPYVLVATKADKLSGNGRAAAMKSLSDFGRPEVPAVLTSSETGRGIAEIWKLLDRALGAGDTDAASRSASTIATKRADGHRGQE